MWSLNELADTFRSLIGNEWTKKQADYYAAVEKGCLEDMQELEKQWTEYEKEETKQAERTTLSNSTNRNGETALILAIKFGHLEIVRYLVEENQADINQSASIIPFNQNGRSIGLPLHAAVMKGDIDLIKFLIEERKVDVNALSASSKVGCFVTGIRYDFYQGINTALHYAVYYLEGEKRGNVVRYLVEHGADMLIRNKCGKLAWEMTHQPADALKLFIELGMNVNHQDQLTGDTIAHEWARSTSSSALEVIQELLLHEGTDFSAKNTEGLTPLTVSALGNLENYDKSKSVYWGPNDAIFESIFQAQSHRISLNEQITALELIGAAHMCLNKDPYCCKQYWKRSIKLRWPKREEHTSIPGIFTDVSELKSAMELKSALNYDWNTPAIITLIRILGPSSRFVQRAFLDE